MIKEKGLCHGIDYDKMMEKAKILSLKDLYEKIENIFSNYVQEKH